MGGRPALTETQRLIRFTKYIDFDVVPDCWIWVGAKTTGPKGKGGYGNFHAGQRKLNGEIKVIKVYAHRFAFENAVGPIPNGMTLDHKCRNRACVNPKHLEPMSLKDNILLGKEFLRSSQIENQER